MNREPHLGGHPRAGAPDWSPFEVLPGPKAVPKARDIRTLEGIGDRLRAVAFAELQARTAFRWAAAHFSDAPDSIRRVWLSLADAEDKHYGWLMNRMQELGVSATGRPVSTRLWDSLMSAATAEEFAHLMSTAEDRGREAGERFATQMKCADPVTAALFGKIAEEERHHVESARRFLSPPSAQATKCCSTQG